MLLIMSDEEDVDVKDWAEQNFQAMKTRLQDLQEEMRNSKPRENINVRRVSADNLQGQDEDQIVVEHSVERWYSVNYFKQMMSDDSSNSSSDDSETIF